MDERAKQELLDAFRKIPPPERPEALAALWEVTANGQGAKKPDLSSKPKYQGVKLDGDSVDFLREHFGTREQLIKQGIYRQDIKAHSPKLVERLPKDAYARGKKTRDFLPIDEDHTEDLAAMVGLDIETGTAVAEPAVTVLRTATSLRGRAARQRTKADHGAPKSALG